MKTLELTAYPMTLTLADRHDITIRPLGPDDADALLRFFLRVPAEERYFLKEDVTSPGVVQGWVEQRDWNRALPLVALAGGEIVADAVLIRRRNGAYRNVASVRIVVDPEWRGQGLGTALLRELCDVAADAELELVMAEFVTDVQDDAIGAAEMLGFIRAATVHELLRDERGRAHDLAVMLLPLGKWYQWSRF